VSAHASCGAVHRRSAFVDEAEPEDALAVAHAIAAVGAHDVAPGPAIDALPDAVCGAGDIVAGPPL